MADNTSGTTLAGAGLGRVLLDSKLAAPLPRRRAVSRVDLIERARASGSRVVAVTAPAGYGKSTMLAEWAAIERRRMAWVALDATDDDPAALLCLLAEACAGVSRAVAAVASAMPGIGGFALGRSAPLLAAALAATELPFVLFIDDVHAVESASCRDVLDVVLGGIPSGSQVVLAGRHEQPFVARLRVLGDLFKVGATDLRVDVAGARQIFDAAGVTSVSDSGVAVAWDRCEGWPAGVFLCALIARDGGDVPSASGDDRFIADYLYRECLERLPVDMQRFLRRTAVLEQLSGALCDAVLETGDSQARLRELETLNLFLIPLDRRRGWYRYHALFREFLLAELRSEDSDQVALLHGRAATWCASNGLPAVAVEHLIAAGDRSRAVRLIAATTLQTYQVGQLGVVDRWMSALGRDAVASFPPLAVFACWRALLLAETAEAERLAQVIDDIRDIGDGEEAARWFDSNRAMVRAAMCARGAERALDDAAHACEREPRWGNMRNTALYLHGSALLLAGDTPRARVAFAEASAGAAVGNPDTVSLCEAELAVLAIEDGNWAGAARHTEAALRIVAANHMDGYATAAFTFAVAARVAVHDGDLPRAEQLLAKGMRNRVLCSYVLPFLALRVRLQLAKAHVAKGDGTAASALAREMGELLRLRPDVGVLAAEVAAFRRELEPMAAGAGAVPLSPAELRVLPYLQTHLSLREIAERLFVSRHTVNSQVASVYRKLGVNARGPAVRRATEMGLLGD